MNSKTPLRDTEVDAIAKPRHESDKEHVAEAERIRQAVRQAVKKAIQDNRHKGHKAQIDAATRAAKEVRCADPKKIDKVKITITGKDPDGDKVTHEITVTPSANK